VPITTSEAWKRLRELDDPDAVERPAGFDEQAVGDRFGALVEALERLFACMCSVDAGFPKIQDATFYGTVSVPAEATSTGGQIAVRVSNFGRIAVYDLELFGAYDSDERRCLLDLADVARVEAALDSTNHESIPVEVLWTVYDGRSDYWKGTFPSASPTWFTRFFDWV
jgi:hypothetical protein